MTETKMATVTQVYTYFSDNKANGYTLSAFNRDWKQLSDQDKTDLKTGIGNGTLTY